MIALLLWGAWELVQWLMPLLPVPNPLDLPAPDASQTPTVGL
jgi:hypothetical protein